MKAHGNTFCCTILEAVMKSEVETEIIKNYKTSNSMFN